ncbi:MAG: IPT/TIG domain-containing protein [Alphaproteobacteria bacterium]|nr:IPT/TIG domain-containing protein [Alphaproteobacteria bacterium]
MQQTLIRGALALAATALPLSLTACDPLGTRAVSIRPIYGWVDGCTTVKISGHGFADGTTATFGGNAIENPTYPDPDSEALDVGYLFYGTTPAGSAPGYVDVVVTSGGETYPLATPFYYEACPGLLAIEDVSMGETVTSGDSIGLTGCGFDASTIKVKVGDAEPVALTSVCSSAQVSFSAPDLPAGTYEVVFTDAGGDQVYPTPGCGVADSGDTATPCEPTFEMTYGGAR